MNTRRRTSLPSIAKATFALGALAWSVFAPQLAFADFPITVLGSFDGKSGNAPDGGVTLDSKGNLYGTTSQGGANNVGTVYELAKGSHTLTVLSHFNGKNGAASFSGVTLDSRGNLYGATSQGGAGSKGTVFELAEGSNRISTLASFNGKNGANPPNGNGITLDSSDNLYGTTNKGGAGGYGTVYEIAKGSKTITTLASFNGKNGAASFSGVTLDSRGNLFGTTAYGGAYNAGTVYEIAKGSNALTTLASFNGKNGANPHGGITLDSRGNLYGTASQGGKNDRGTVYTIAKGSSVIVVLSFFNGTNGAIPFSSVTLDSRGSLYGTTFGGGVNNNGVVYEIAGAAAPEI